MFHNTVGEALDGLVLALSRVLVLFLGLGLQKENPKVTQILCEMVTKVNTSIICE